MSKRDFGRLAVCYVLSPCILFGCAVTHGTEFDTRYVEQIVVGKTTKSDLLQNLGQPAKRTRNGSSEAWEYSFEVRKANASANVNSEAHFLTIIFDGERLTTCKSAITSFKGGWLSTESSSDVQDCGAR